MKNAKLLLERLTELIPPGEMMHHNLIVENDSLVVSLMLDEQFFPIVLDETDLDKPVNKLADEIFKIFVRNFESAQDSK